jgi:hypothetical protein
MKANVSQRAITITLGIIAVAISSWTFMPAITSDTFSISTALIETAAIYFVTGILVGSFWRFGDLRGGYWLAVPLFFVTILSALFTGIFAKFLTNDIPLLITALLMGILGCYVGRLVTSFLPARKSE